MSKRIGIVTSPKGAAIRDILSVLNRRFPNLETLIYPVKVQGDDAKYEISKAINYLNTNYKHLDVLIVGRGGGSLEDLWAFNEEIVARAIANSKIPVISCVGHEIDFTIADFVSDLRAPTPSVAAELVVKEKAELINNINKMKQRFLSNIKYLVSRYSEKLKNLSSQKIFKKPLMFYEEKIQQIDDYYSSLSQYFHVSLDRKKHDWKISGEKLNLLSPLNILCRGYSVCYKLPENKIVRDVDKLKKDDIVKVKVCKGEFNACVEEIR